MISVEAPAKLTLSLSITGVRNDGFHLIDAEMVTLNICDDILIENASTTSLTITGPYAHGIPTDDSNLVAKALHLLGRTAEVQIQKNIPHGGGLGGGSADAAAVLVGARFTDLVAAAALGSDIAFCMVGGRARVTGVGEIVQSLPFIHHDITLVIPPMHISTPVVYRMWDTMGGPRGENGNDLEPAALVAYPELVSWKEKISAACATTPFLAGSGATWFLYGHHQGLNQALKGAKVVYTTTRPPNE